MPIIESYQTNRNMDDTRTRPRTYCFNYQTKKKSGHIEVQALSYSAAIAEMKKQIKGIQTFQVQ